MIRIWLGGREEVIILSIGFRKLTERSIRGMIRLVRRRRIMMMRWLELKIIIRLASSILLIKFKALILLTLLIAFLTHIQSYSHLSKK